MRQRHDDAVLLNEILQIDLAVHHADLRAAFVGILGFNRQNLLADNAQHHLLICQHGTKIRNRLLQLGVFFLQTLALQSGQAGKAHIQNRLRLLVRERKAFHELRLGFGGIRAVADDADDFIDIIQRDEQAF